jgi:transposase, IS5 family
MELDMSKIEMVCLEDLVSKTHPYRRFREYLPKSLMSEHLRGIEQVKGASGYGIERLFLCLLLQFMEDLSDRELERFLRENNAAKWFCGFTLSEKTPDYSLFTHVRSGISANKLSMLFSSMRNQLKDAGLMSEVFTFVDATHLISKANLWQERDKAIAHKMEKLNNETLPKVAVDKQARMGCKGKDKYWYGYKGHVSVDMQSGLINKVAITPANLTDAQGMKHVCPSQGAIYGDKGYCTAPARKAAARRGCYLAAIKRNNMKDKNKDLDRWVTKIRSPYERVFSQRNKQVRYRGVEKNQFAAFFNAIAFNLKRLIIINAPPPTAA